MIFLRLNGLVFKRMIQVANTAHLGHADRRQSGILQGRMGTVSGIAWHRDGRLLASVGKDQAMRVGCESRRNSRTLSFLQSSAARNVSELSRSPLYPQYTTSMGRSIRDDQHIDVGRWACYHLKRGEFG